MTIDNTSQCEDCKYNIIDEDDPARVMCFCKLDERWRIYGSHLECSRKEEETKD